MKTDEAATTAAAVGAPLEQRVVPLAPKRVQLSRAKGWRMPENTAKVDRTTKWGNPFAVGKDGTRAECLDLFEKLLAGYVCMTKGDPAVSEKYLGMVFRDRAELAGKNLACWCPLSAPCHADYLLVLANHERHNARAKGPSRLAGEGPA